MYKIYNRNGNLVKQGDDSEIAGFEYDLLTKEEADDSDFGYFKDYNDPMLTGETREVIWISRDGKQEIEVGTIERDYDEEESEDY